METRFYLICAVITALVLAVYAHHRYQRHRAIKKFRSELTEGFRVWLVSDTGCNLPATVAKIEGDTVYLVRNGDQETIVRNINQLYPF